MSDDHIFIFDFVGSFKRKTARNIHFRRLWDILQLSLQRNDYPRASRAWSILVRCKEFDWMKVWTTGASILAGRDDAQLNPRGIEYLRAVMLQCFEDRPSIIKELVLNLIMAGRHRDALDELDLYLPSFPYQDNPVLHIYAGLLSLYLAQPSSDSDINSVSVNESLLREAQAQFERAKALDPDNVLPADFLEKMSSLAPGTWSQENHDSGDEIGERQNEFEQRRKRFRSSTEPGQEYQK